MRFQIGDITLDLLRTGRFRLDGGAMFGVVPRPLWVKKAPPDARNRIPLGLNCLLLRTAGRVVLVDTGIGDKWDEKRRDIYGIETEPGLEREIRRAGAAPEDIHTVLDTHLHFDHAGGNTRALPDGSVVPAFPGARYVVQRGNLFEEALRPNERRRASYVAENFAPIEERGLFDLIEGDVEVEPGVRVVVTGGHQRFHQVVIVESRGEAAVFLGDIVPTAAHVDPPWIMAYDDFPQETLERKKDLLGQAADRGWLVILEHEPERPAGRVFRDGDRFRYEPCQTA